LPWLILQRLSAKGGGTLFRVLLKADTYGRVYVGFNLTNGVIKIIQTHGNEHVDMRTVRQDDLDQRAYSANAKNITTSDEMTQEVLTLSVNV
jgi:flagellar hook protein FlgE